MQEGLVREEKEPISGEIQEDPGLATGPATAIKETTNGPGWAWWPTMTPNNESEAEVKAKIEETEDAKAEDTRAEEATEATKMEMEIKTEEASEASIADATMEAEDTRAAKMEMDMDETSLAETTKEAEDTRTRTPIEALMESCRTPHGDGTAEQGAQLQTQGPPQAMPLQPAPIALARSIGTEGSPRTIGDLATTTLRQGDRNAGSRSTSTKGTAAAITVRQETGEGRTPRGGLQTPAVAPRHQRIPVTSSGTSEVQRTRDVSATDIFQTSHYNANNSIWVFDDQPLPRLNTMIDAYLRKMTNARKRRQGTFKTDPGVLQAVLTRCMASAKACPLCFLVGKRVHSSRHLSDYRPAPASRSLAREAEGTY